MKKNIVIIGSGIAGLAAAESARAEDKSSRITLVEMSNTLPYSRCGLPYVVSGKVNSEELVLKEKSVLDSLSIRLLLRRKVSSIDREKKRVIFEGSSGLEGEDYDALILATGSSKGELAVPGSTKRGLHRLHDLHDAEELRRAANLSKTALVIGSGPVPLVLSEQLNGMKIKSTLVCEDDQLLHGFLDKEPAEQVKLLLKEEGIEVVTGKEVTNFVGFERVQGAVVGGEVILADITVVTGHLSPNTDVAKKAGLTTGASGRIIVDSRMRTSDESIFAAGDACELKSQILDDSIPLQPASLAIRSGIVAGKNAAGGDTTLPPVVRNISFRLDGIDISSVGLTEDEARQKGENIIVSDSSEYQFASYYPGGRYLYSKLISSAGVLIGAQFIGPGASVWGNLASMMIANSLPVEHLADLETSFSPLTQPYWPSPSVAARRILKGS